MSSGLTDAQISRLEIVFKDIDLDGSGQIDHDELASAFRGLGFTATKEEIDKLISSVDENDSKTISKEEFITMMSKLPADQLEAQNPFGYVILRSLLSRAVFQNAKEANKVINAISGDPTPHVLPEVLNGCAFVGHLCTDMDSIAMALGCQELFDDGIAARASEVNAETKFALEYWGFETPPPIEDIDAKTQVCLVDHNQSSQQNKHVDAKRIVGVIDHHALQSQTIVTNLPIYVNIQPWGSGSSVITNMFIQARRQIPKSIAGILLSGILSDTLNLNSPTTTQADRLIVAILAKLSQVEDVDSYAQAMFKAKSAEILSVSSHGLVRGDLKFFNYTFGDNTYNLAFGVIETVDDQSVLDQRKEELIIELRALKVERKCEFAFLGVINIVSTQSTILICGPGESALAQEAFNLGAPDADGLLKMGSKPSRKKDFIPPLSEVIASGWTPPAGSLEINPADVDEIIIDRGSQNMVTRAYSNK